MHEGSYYALYHYLMERYHCYDSLSNSERAWKILNDLIYKTSIIFGIPPSEVNQDVLCAFIEIQEISYKLTAIEKLLEQIPLGTKA